MVWLSPAEREPAETKAEALLQQTLRAKPNYIPAHEAYCRFLNATNQFSASPVACARARLTCARTQSEPSTDPMLAD
jgi:hypothetical protein